MGETIRRLFNRGIRALYRPPISAEEEMFNPSIINCWSEHDCSIPWPCSNSHQSSIACESINQEQILYVSDDEPNCYSYAKCMCLLELNICEWMMWSGYCAIKSMEPWDKISFHHRETTRIIIVIRWYDKRRIHELCWFISCKVVLLYRVCFRDGSVSSKRSSHVMDKV